MYRFTRKTILLLFLLLIAFPLSTPSNAQSLTPSFQQNFTIESYGLVKLNFTLSLSASNSVTLDKVEVIYPNYASCLVNYSSNVHVSLTIDENQLRFVFTNLEIGKGALDLKVNIWLFPLFKFKGVDYVANYTVIPDVKGVNLTHVESTLTIPKGVKIMTKLEREGFVEVEPRTWKYRADGNITYPKIIALDISPDFPYAFSNLEITKLQREYVQKKDDEILIEDKMWIKLYDDKFLYSVRVADYLSTSEMIRVKVGISDFVYTTIRSSLLSLPYPLAKGVNFIELKYFVKELPNPCPPPILGLIRNAEVHAPNVKPVTISNSTFLPNLNVQTLPVYTPITAYVDLIVFAIMLFAILYIASYKKREKFEPLLSKRDVVLDYLRLYERSISKTIEKEDFEKERRRLDARRSKINSEIMRLKNKLGKEGKKELVEKLTEVDKELDQAIKLARQIRELYTANKIKQKKAINKIKEISDRVRSLEVK